MYQHHPASARGQTRIDWLDSRHSFSFGRYHDPANMGFRALRVINDDRIAPGGGFPTHPHDNMEIITWVLEGAVAHRDSMGSTGVIRPGEAQVMSAGTGLTHSEFNASAQDPLWLLQIWLLPGQRNVPPRYDQKAFPVHDEHDRWHVIADGTATPDPVAFPLAQDARLSIGRFTPGTEMVDQITPGRHRWLHLARGRIQIGDRELVTGDGMAVSEESVLSFAVIEDSEVLLFDLA